MQILGCNSNQIDRALKGEMSRVRPFRCFKIHWQKSLRHLGMVVPCIEERTTLKPFLKVWEKQYLKVIMLIWCLLLPCENKKYCRDDDEDFDHSVYFKQKVDPPLNRSLSIIEFILAVTRYMNVFCEVFSYRRRELIAYPNDITRLGSFRSIAFLWWPSSFLHKRLKLYCKHDIFSLTGLQCDQDLYFSVFAGLRPMSQSRSFHSFL